MKYRSFYAMSFLQIVRYLDDYRPSHHWHIRTELRQRIQCMHPPLSWLETCQKWWLYSRHGLDWMSCARSAPLLFSFLPEEHPMVELTGDDSRVLFVHACNRAIVTETATLMIVEMDHHTFVLDYQALDDSWNLYHSWLDSYSLGAPATPSVHVRINMAELIQGIKTDNLTPWTGHGGSTGKIKRILIASYTPANVAAAIAELETDRREHSWQAWIENR